MGSMAADVVSLESLWIQKDDDGALMDFSVSGDRDEAAGALGERLIPLSMLMKPTNVLWLGEYSRGCNSLLLSGPGVFDACWDMVWVSPANLIATIELAVTCFAPSSQFP